jgi:hypothetical protein
MNIREERTAELREGEARWTVTVTPWNGAAFDVTVRGFGCSHAAARALQGFGARTVAAFVTPQEWCGVAS